MESEIEVNGRTYRKIEPVESRPLRICILERGRIVVGRVTLEDNYLVIHDASCIRRWGTTAGLGEIATGGPTADTVLDPQPTTRVHELRVVEQIDCEVTSWNK